MDQACLLTVTAKDFRKNFTKYQQVAINGQSMMITRNTKPIMKISPPDEFGKEVWRQKKSESNIEQMQEFIENYWKNKPKPLRATAEEIDKYSF